MESRKIDDILTSVLRMSDDELDRCYAEIAPEVDPIAELTKLADRMTPAEKASAQGQSLIGFLQQGLLFSDPVIADDHVDHCVLLIGDEQSHLESRQRQFAALGIGTMVASTAVEGLSRLETGHFDAAVLECRPKAEDEIDACSQILRRLTQLPVISLVGDLVVTDRDALDRDVLRAVARLLGEHVPNRLSMKKGPQAESGGLFQNEMDNCANG